MDAGSLAARVGRLRTAAGLTQGQLAARTGISRQMVGAIEAGRHLPRVDTGAALAVALGTTVEALLAPDPTAVVPVTGGPAAAAGPVRLGRVGEQLVCAAAPAGGDGWAPADGVVRDGAVDLLPGARPGVVVAGCDPAIGLAARLIADRGGPRLLAAGASTRAALDALLGGRTHAAVVHGPAGDLPDPPAGVRRWHLARWQVGLAAAADLPAGWWRDALAGRCRVVQRDPGAGSQQAFLRALAGHAARSVTADSPAGPVAGSHLDAALLAQAQGLVAVTIEPVALATGLAFHALETHTAQLWVAGQWAGEPGIAVLGEELTASAFHRQLAAVGGYDLAGCGTVVAA